MMARSEQATFFIDAAAECFRLARLCRDVDLAVSQRIVELGRKMLARAVDFGAAPDELPDSQA